MSGVFHTSGKPEPGARSLGSAVSVWQLGKFLSPVDGEAEAAEFVVEVEKSFVKLEEAR